MLRTSDAKSDSMLPYQCDGICVCELYVDEGRKKDGLSCIVNFMEK